MMSLMWFLLKDPHVPGPLIKGKPVTFWTRQLRVATFDVDVIGSPVTEKDVALPALVRQLSLHDSLVRDSVKGLWRQLPAGLRGRFREPMTSAELRAGAATARCAVVRWVDIERDAAAGRARGLQRPGGRQPSTGAAIMVRSPRARQGFRERVAGCHDWHGCEDSRPNRTRAGPCR
jgi:hypothetical protein